MKCMRLIGRIAVIFFITLGALARSPETAQPEYRMAWVLTYNENINSPASIKAVVDEARRTNLNALLPIAHRRGRAYYASSFLPVFNPTNASPPTDTLTEFIRAAHNTSGGKAYIEVHPWVVLFAVWLEAKAPPPGHVSLLHPEWLTKKFKPAPAKPGKVPQKWLDPGVPGACEYIVEVCKEIVSNYDVDGLNLDYVRYRQGGYGYNPIALGRFRKCTGRTDTPAPKDTQWQTWQREQITNLLRRIYIETKAIKPHLKISVCTIIWGSPAKPFKKGPAYTWTMQDWQSWFLEGIADINLPMNYRSEVDGEKRADFRTWSSICKKWSNGRLCVNGLGNYLNTISGSLSQIEATRKSGCDGVSLFRFGVNNSEKKPYTELLKALKKRPYNRIAPVPQTHWLDKPKTGMLHGFVYSAADAAPADDVEVSLVGTKHTTHTDGSGYYGFVQVKPGSYRISVRDDKGLHVETKKVRIERGRVTKRDIILP